MKRNFYTNIDINSVVTPFLTQAMHDVDAGRAEPVGALYPFVDVYAGSQLTDVLFDIFCQFSNTDSEIWSDYSFKYEQTEENGVAVDYHPQYEGIYAFNRRFGVDPYRVWIDRCRQNGLRAWLSIRMNDCHCPDDEAGFLRSEFFYEARRKGWMVGAHYGYYRHCFDYAVPEVRNRMLAYIEEQLNRYSADGLELDFSRELICFDYVNNPDCCGIMNEFMREVKRLVEKAEEKCGHKILIGVRLMRDMEQCRVYGFDPRTWVNEQLVDMLCVCPRWASCDSDMPIAAWKQAFPHTEIAAGVTDLILRSSDNVGCSPATIAGYSLRYLGDGADSMYLFNFFMNPYCIYAPRERDILEINNRCGRMDSVSTRTLRHIVTYQDAVPEPCTPWRPLPLTVNAAPVPLSVKLGGLPKSRSYAVILGFTEGSPEGAEIRLDGQPLTEFTPVTHGAVEPTRLPFTAAVLYRCEIAPPAADTLLFTFRANRKQVAVCIGYVEIEIF